MTVSVAELLPVPPVLVQASVYVNEPAVPIVPVVTVPEAALEPDHEPLAVHELGLLVALQVIVELEPVLIDAGLTEILTTGTAITVSVADLVSLPALFEQAKV